MSASLHDARLLRGVELFNRGEFFECHDVFEEYWNELRGDERLCIQGLIQVAVACYHALNGNFRGSASQFDKALAKLRVQRPSMFGLESETFLECVAQLREAAVRCLADPAIAFPAQSIPALLWTDGTVSDSSII